MLINIKILSLCEGGYLILGEFDKLNNADINGLIDTWNRRVITLRVMIVVFAAFFVSVCVYLYRLNKYTTLVNTYIAKVDEYAYKLDELSDCDIEELLNIEYKRL